MFDYLVVVVGDARNDDCCDADDYDDGDDFQKAVLRNEVPFDFDV